MGSSKVRSARLAVALVAAAALSAAAAGGAQASEVVYNNIPSPLPGNFASFGNEAYSLSEFGGMVEFTGTAHKKQTVTVAMSSWACQYGGVYQDTCETPKPTKKFEVADHAEHLRSRPRQHGRQEDRDHHQELQDAL